VFTSVKGWSAKLLELILDQSDISDEPQIVCRLLFAAAASNLTAPMMATARATAIAAIYFNHQSIFRF
jgi:hypothetical protein